MVRVGEGGGGREKQMLSGGDQSRQRFTLAELEKLCTLLRGRYAVITPGNAAAVVETLRSVAELMIWGDQVRPVLLCS